MQNEHEYAGTPSLYAVLGVSPDASVERIVHAYRQRALASHPDAHPDDPGASARFTTLTSAYEVLSDPVRRAEYDDRTAGTPKAVPQRRGVEHDRAPSVRTRDPRWRGATSPDQFIGVRPPRPSGPELRAGPVRIEARSPGASGVYRSRDELGNPEVQELASVLLRFLLDRWPE